MKTFSFFIAACFSWFSATADETRILPVTGGIKYTLQFEAAIDGAVESIEDNPRFAIFHQLWKKNAVLPFREIAFLDAAEKMIGSPLVLSIPFRERRMYRDVFYTPRDAHALRVRFFSPEGIPCKVHDLNLDKTPDEGALNINPTFALGATNYSGWRNVSDGGSLIELDGKTIFDTKYGSRGTRIPLPGPGTYALSAKATGNGYNSCVKVDLFDAEGKELMSSTLRRYSETQVFIPPEEAVSASLLVYSCLLEEVRFVRVGDEAALEKYRKPIK